MSGDTITPDGEAPCKLKWRGVIWPYNDYTVNYLIAGPHYTSVAAPHC